MTDPCKAAILSADIFGIFALLVLIHSIGNRRLEWSRRQSTFAILLCAILFSEMLNAVTCIPLKRSELGSLYYFCLMAGKLVPFFVLGIFMRYLFYYYSSPTKPHRIAFTVILLLCVVGIVCTTVYSLQGKLYVVENGVCRPGEYHEGYMGFYAISILFATLVILISAEKLGRQNALFAIIFMLIPFPAIAVSLIHPGLDFAVASLSLAAIFVHNTLQNERERDLVLSERENTQRARTDELTGLQNRLAFNESCGCKTGDDPIGIVFSDLNCLKYINDTKGHKAGDDYLVKFSAVLTSIFRWDDVFRLSGDEFVIMLDGIPESVFKNKSTRFLERLESTNPIMASVGCAYGQRDELESLVEQAEKNMYEMKKVFHQQNPQYSRPEL